jgi:predicted DsbA family dithiol-disulfide isomerase
MAKEIDIMTQQEATVRGFDPAQRPITIDVVSDVVCPWCWIGKRKLEEALRGFDDGSVEVRWRPFQLDPSIPPEGYDRKTYIERKFGGPEKTAEIYARIAAAGREVGIAFAFDKIARSPNTLDAHRVIRWAHSAGLQSQVKETLMRLFFIEGADIGDHEVLATAARDSGLDGDIVARLLAEGADVEAVRQEAASAAQMGITGVPFFILDSRFAVPGAQSAEGLAAAIAKARAETPAGLA